MDFFTSDVFVTIVSVVVSVAGLLLALRADIGKRIDRVEGRARADHQELVAEVGKVKTAVSELKTAVAVVSTKLDERSAPQRLIVQEPPGEYTVGNEPEGGPEP